MPTEASNCSELFGSFQNATVNGTTGGQTNLGPIALPLIVLDAIAIGLNSAFAWTFSRSPRIRLIPFNWLLLNVCVCDLFYALVDTPLYILYYHSSSPPASRSLCRYWELNGALTSTVIQPAVACLALDRLAAVFTPIQYKEHRSVRNSVWVIAILWTSALILNLPGLVIDWTVVSVNASNTTCGIDTAKQYTWSTVCFSVAYVVPMIIIVLTPIPLLLKLKARKRTVLPLSVGEPSEGDKRKEWKRDRDNNVVLAMSTAACVCCYLPVDIIYLTDGNWDAATVFALLSSILNALIYQHTNAVVRGAFGRTFCRRRGAGPPQATVRLTQLTFHEQPGLIR